MKILIIGDIFGRPGKNILKEKLLTIKKEYNIDLVFANAENISRDGKGISHQDYLDLKDYGVDFITLGNHAFKDLEIYDFINNYNDIIRPANFLDKSLPGMGFVNFTFNNKKVLLINLLGKELMFSKVKSPFLSIDKILNENEHDLAILDFHAETTSEKKVLSYYLKDRVKVFYGTHTHIQTNDAEVNSSQQAYITDVGMTGIVDSAIGVEYDGVLRRLLKNDYVIFKEKLKGIVQLSSVIIEIDEENMLPIKISPLNIKTKE